MILFGKAITMYVTELTKDRDIVRVDRTLDLMDLEKNRRNAKFLLERLEAPQGFVQQDDSFQTLRIDSGTEYFIMSEGLEEHHCTSLALA